MKTLRIIDNDVIYELAVGSFPAMTEAQRDALPVGAPHGVCPGDYIYNLTSGCLNYRDAQGWVAVQAV